ncbi:MAG: flagellar basal body P-ring formation chaperone FlgA [Candidatus Desantisbacteria bacterium]
MKLLGFVIGALFFCLIIFWVSMGYCLELTLKTDTVVDGDGIFLKDIVSFSSGLPLETGNISIGTSPLPGRSRSIKATYVNLRLKQAGREDISLVGEKTMVVRSSQRLDINKAVEVAKDYLASIYNKENIKITPYSVPDEVILPKGEVTIQADNTYKLPALNKRLSIPIIVKINGKQPQMLRIGLEIQELQWVVVAVSDIKIKQIIIASDLRVEERDVTYLRQIPIINMEEAIGKRATAFIKQGNILTTTHVECPPYINVGDKVIITSKTGNLIITAPGISCEDGMIGKRINVKNSDSKKIVNGVVCEGRRILID